MSQTNTPLKETALKIILIVEDDADIGEMLVQTFNEQLPYQVMLVPDALRALKIVKTFKPNLFILDYQLPGMNGLELHDILHHTEELKHIPTLFMSANMPAIEAKKRHAPYIRKPFDFEEMLELIQRLLAD